MSACWHVALLMVLFSIQSRRTHAAGSSPRSAQVTSMLPQNGGAWFGSAVDASAYNYKLSNYTRKLGIEPASYILFAHLPLTTSDKTLLSYMLPQMGRKRAICLFTVELAGLNSSVVTDDHLKELAQFLATYEQQGVTFIVRFAHEMNGSWYPWAQQPIAYRQMFRKAAEMIYQYTCSATMLWAPNEAAGYPFRGGRYETVCDFSQVDMSPECTELDTNGDRVIDMRDDMYSPYYPGDDVVDWVGMSLYHFGAVYPWGQNHVPEPKKYTTKLTGTYFGTNSDYTDAPDFYGLFCGEHGKPMIIGETGALWNLCDKFPNQTAARAGGCTEQTAMPDELDVKQTWWQQVFNVQNETDVADDIATRFPNIKIVHWFDYRKLEVEAQNNTVDWTISFNDKIRTAFLEFLTKPKVLPNGTQWHYWQNGTAFASIENKCWVDPNEAAYRTSTLAILVSGGMFILGGAVLVFIVLLECTPFGDALFQSSSKQKHELKPPSRPATAGRLTAGQLSASLTPTLSYGSRGNSGVHMSQVIGRKKQLFADPSFELSEVGT
eukprot:jgi/Chrzof1/13885/Cz08g16030.t1